MAATVPSCKPWDPAFAYELALILEHGMREQLEQQQDVFYYITLSNESYPQPSLPAGVEADLLKGMYRFASHTPNGQRGHVQLLGSGAILREVIAAAELLAQDWQVASDVFSVTSFALVARDAAAVERHNRLHPDDPARQSHLAQQLSAASPSVAATDYIRAYPQLIAPYVAGRFIALGTDGFGRSDTRPALRRFFEVDRHSIVLAALHALADAGAIDQALSGQALRRYELPADQPAPWER